MAPELQLDDLDNKIALAFPGRFVRKDLVKKLKVGFNIPIYVLEYLLGKYCSTTNEDEITKGLELVKSAIAERIVRPDQTESIKAQLQVQGTMKLIDHVSVTFDEKVAGGKFWAKLTTCSLDKVHIDHSLVYGNERLLTGGIWANVELNYDDTLGNDGAIRPFVIRRLSPIQIASSNFSEFVAGRATFTREEWINLLIRSMGYNADHPDLHIPEKTPFPPPVCPDGRKELQHDRTGTTGNGQIFRDREMSPNVILLSGGQGSVADLFGWKGRKDKPGLVMKFDLVAFDEVAGSDFKAEQNKQIYKGYMEQGSFSRGDDKGTTSADAGIVFNGNIDGDVETTARMSHLFNVLPESIRNDMAFHDRWHAYLPGWEIPKMQVDYFTSHLGFISDYLAEIFHNELRKRNYTDLYDRYFSLGSHIEERDRKAIAKTTSGNDRALHPDGNCSKAEMEEYLSFAMELRRRVKEQLKRMGGIEYSKVNFSYINKESGQEHFVSCMKTVQPTLIRKALLHPVIFSRSVMIKRKTGMHSIVFRFPRRRAGHRFNVVGTKGKGMKESARMAYDYLKANSGKIGIDRDISSYDVNIQIMSLMQGKDAGISALRFT